MEIGIQRLRYFRPFPVKHRIVMRRDKETAFQVFYVKGFLGFPSSIYLKMVLVRAVPVTLFAGITSYYLRQCYFGNSLVDLIVCTSISILIVLSTILSIGMKQDERTYLYHIIKNKIRK